jgi:uncharacterized protein YdeI (YjbR/CyaY-like superfamily)
MEPKVDKYLSTTRKWQEEQKKLRTIVLECGLTEDLKWGKPCYSYNEKNIVVIQGFNAYCALLFFKGFLLNDPEGILVKTGENTRVGRQIRFTDVREIVKLKATLKAYIYEAIEVEKAGLKGNLKMDPKPIPKEFQDKLDAMPALKKAFDDLTPGRQRAYVFHFSAPKLSKTRAARVENCMRQILKGRGLNE